MASPRQHIIHYEDPPPAQELTSSQVNNFMFFYVKLPRRRYSTVCTEDRERIVQAYRDGSDYVAVARRLCVRRTTAWSIVARWQNTGETATQRRRGNSPRKIDNEMLDFCLNRPLRTRTTSATKSSGLPGRTNPACRQRPSAGLYMVRSSQSKSG